MASTGPEQGDTKYRDELEAWRHIIEHADWSIAIGSADGTRLERVTPAFARQHGYTVEELTGRPIVDVFPPEVRDQVAQHIATAHEQGHHVYDSVHLRRDGSTFPVRIDITAVKAPDGRVLYRAVHVLDLSDRKRLDMMAARQAAIAANLTEGLVVVRVEDMTIVYVNRSAEEIFGYGPGELIGRPAEMLNAPTERSAAEFAVDVRAGLEREGVWRGEFCNLRKDGTTFTGYANVSYFDDAQEGPHWIALITDISERKRTEAALVESEARFRTVFEDGPVGMAILDVDLRFSRANDALGALLETDSTALVGRAITEFVPPDDVEHTIERGQQLFARRLTGFQVEQRYVTAHGRTGWAQFSVSFVAGDDGRRPYAIAILEDITARKEAEAQLFHRAWHDHLTGLPNRALLGDHLQQALSRSERTLEHLAVLFIDLDGFKHVNDTFGHDHGDAVLIEQAHRIVGCLRPSDTAARLGGDEFVVCLSPLNRHRSLAEAEAIHVAERIERTLVRPIPIRRRKAVVPASIGIVVASADDRSPDMLIRAADDAMYEAKASGRGRYAMSH